jgi:hypothetical protein
MAPCAVVNRFDRMSRSPGGETEAPARRTTTDPGHLILRGMAVMDLAGAKSAFMA